MTVLLVVLTVVEVLLVVVVLTGYLVVIAQSLRRSTLHLSKVAFGVRAIEKQCEPIGPSVLRLNATLAALADALPAGDRRG